MIGLAIPGGVPPGRPPALTPAQQFDCGIKKDKDHYPEFKEEKYWDNFRRGVETTADTHGTYNVLNGTYVPLPGDETDLFRSRN